MCYPSLTPQPATIDHGQLPPRRFSHALCVAEHFPTDSLLCLPFGVNSASPTSASTTWWPPTTSLASSASPIVCHRRAPSFVEHHRQGAIPVSFTPNCCPKWVHHLTDFPSTHFLATPHWRSSSSAAVAASSSPMRAPSPVHFGAEPSWCFGPANFGPRHIVDFLFYPWNFESIQSKVQALKFV
jgi:hypothetical protein